ncbi:retrovirus-related pol polyprotein from transposon TNT 1-94 [Tanacetum coccineum]
MICNEPWKVTDASLITETNNNSFEINDLKAQLQHKSIVVNELQQLLATLKEKSQMTSCETSDVDSRIQKLDDENVSLAFSVSSLEKERDHLKLVYKNLYDSIKQTRAQNKVKIDSLQQNLNNQIFENETLKAQFQTKFYEPIQNHQDCIANVKNVDLSSNYANVCLSCNECLFSANHDVCVVKYKKDVQKRKKAKSVKQKEKLQWKPTQRVFTTILSTYTEDVGITHQTSVARTLQQNGVAERRNRALVEAARTMLIFSKSPLFLWADDVATACYTQNRSLIYTRYNKTPYELLRDRKPDLKFLYIFGALCYPKNDNKDLGKLKPKADIGIFIGYSPSKKAYRIYNKRTRMIMETIHVQFYELTQMASE